MGLDFIVAETGLLRNTHPLPLGEVGRACLTPSIAVSTTKLSSGHLNTMLCKSGDVSLSSVNTLRPTFATRDSHWSARETPGSEEVKRSKFSSSNRLMRISQPRWTVSSPDSRH
ncbi:hypothetical protein ACG873_13940 [Mesorhizobium sp. AaZ16]|uniref:hypothetical protein n=1 Tax=Mesorhizobium sp. AaZ16 TaxID=3402289 RepID=UPI00374F3287